MLTLFEFNYIEFYENAINDICNADKSKNRDLTMEHLLYIYDVINFEKMVTEDENNV